MKHSIVLKRDHFGDIHQFNVSVCDGDLSGIWYSLTVKNEHDSEASDGGTDDHPYGFMDKQTAKNIIKSLRDAVKELERMEE